MVEFKDLKVGMVLYRPKSIFSVRVVLEKDNEYARFIRIRILPQSNKVDVKDDLYTKRWSWRAEDGEDYELAGTSHKHKAISTIFKLR